MSLLAVDGIGVRFGGVRALDNVSLELNRGEILGLIGPNGAGKTTLFNVITGVIPPTEGEVRFRDRPLGGMKPHRRAELGIARTFQNLQLFGSMTVLENVMVPIDALRRRNMLSDALALPYTVHAERAADAQARAILHVLDLLEHADTLAADLPVGIQRRVEVARALAMRPRLLLLDEPAAGLDASETHHLGELLQVVRDRFQLSMLLVDHDMSLVMRACDYIYVLDFGKLLAKGLPAEVRDNPRVVAAYLGQAEAASETGAESEVAAGADLDEQDGEPVGELVAVAATAGPRPAARRTDETLLEVESIAAGYGHMEVVRDVSLRVGRGEVVACVGANGAGKTTTLRALSGVIHARRGRVTFAGTDITHAAADRIVGLGLMHVPQGRGLFPKLSVEETLRLASYSGHAGHDLSPAYDVFPKLHQRRRQLVGTLSGGEQQMVAMARALLVRPQLLMVDEMSQGLAPAIVQQLFKTIEVFRDEGIAVLLVEQFVDSALAVADRAYVFESGTITVSATAAELREDRSVIEGSYLGSAAGPGETVEVPSERQLVAAGARAAGAPTEDFMLSLPSALLRSLQQRAESEGRPAADVVRELLEAGGR